jgi:hypothetical protein
MKWHDQKNPKQSLSSDAQLSIKRSKLAVSIILKESDESAKYDLFQRLNTGGSQLSPQEVRNCLLVMVNKKMYEWLRELANHESFISTTALSDRPVEESFDLELVLRFMVFHNLTLSQNKTIGDIGVFLTDHMTQIAKDSKFKYKENEKIFKTTFDLLDQSVGENAFKRFSVSKNKHEGGFLQSQFEVVALGLAHNVRNQSSIVVGKIPKTVQSIWSNKNYTEWAGSGLTATRRVPKLIPLGRTLFHK